MSTLISIMLVLNFATIDSIAKMKPVRLAHINITFEPELARPIKTRLPPLKRIKRERTPKPTPKPTPSIRSF